MDIEETINPGERLKEILQELYPSDFSENKSSINRIDRALDAQGNLASVVYRSTINYMLRRLVTAAVFVRRKCEQTGQSEENVEIEIKRFINRHYDFPNITIVEKITSLLLVCTRMRRASIGSAVGKVVKDRNENHCYLCGRDLNFIIKNDDDWAELEHVFPKSMGGSSRLPSNIKYACSKCNQSKKSYIDDSDLHYEQICFVTDMEDGENFWGNFSREFKIAIWSRNDFRCQFCNQPASKLGSLHFTRSNPHDSWHFLNIEAYCSSHILMINKQRRS